MIFLMILFLPSKFNSAPLYVLLNLVNSESHNYTAEVVFRHSLNNWSHDFPNKIH